MWRVGNRDTAGHSGGRRAGSCSRRHSGHGPGRHGFTVLEAVVALAIVGLVTVGVLSAISSQLRTLDKARRMIVAEALAEDRLAVIQLLTSPEIQSLPDSIARGRFAPPFDGYTWRASADPIPGENYVDEVRLIVEWPGGAYTMATRLYRPPPRVS